jgi:hypothetical protein
LQLRDGRNGRFLETHHRECEADQHSSPSFIAPAMKDRSVAVSCGRQLVPARGCGQIHRSIDAMLFQPANHCQSSATPILGGQAELANGTCEIALDSVSRE